ncbi:replication-relaxation family protein [Actinocatenispora thailandica]|uniref:replication-relaxation family protein n=1 Tax=Actinocatenispora thailandica TaxID=227318 RepID=UPI00194F704A
MVDTHRVLTSRQITHLCFGSETTARTRLSALTSMRVLARFRPRRDLGSHPWHHVLDSGDAFLLEHDIDDRDHRRHRTDQRLAWATSQRLGHLLGINSFFTTLAAVVVRRRASR